MRPVTIARVGTPVPTGDAEHEHGDNESGDAWVGLRHVRTTRAADLDVPGGRVPHLGFDKLAPGLWGSKNPSAASRPYPQLQDAIPGNGRPDPTDPDRAEPGNRRLPWISLRILLWTSSPRARERQDGVDLTSDVALQAANDLGLGLTLSQAPRHVSLRGLVPTQSGHHDSM